MKTNKQLKAWAEAACAKLNETAEGTMPDALSAHTKVRAMRRSITALRSQGYTWTKLATMLKEDPIGISVKPSTLRRLAGTCRARAAATD